MAKLRVLECKEFFRAVVEMVEAIAHMLADMAIEVKAARALTWRAAIIAAGTSKIQRNIIAGLMGLKV